MGVPGLYYIENARIIPKTGSWFFKLFFETFFDDKKLEQECCCILMLPIFLPLGVFLMFFVPLLMMVEAAIRRTALPTPWCS